MTSKCGLGRSGHLPPPQPPTVREAGDEGIAADTCWCGEGCGDEHVGCTDDCSDDCTADHRGEL